jgi:hypothetical protein
MNLSWIATPYGVAAVCAVCVLVGFIVHKGIFWDKDDKVLKVGSKKHPETLVKFYELSDMVRKIGEKLDNFIETTNRRLDEVKEDTLEDRLIALRVEIQLNATSWETKLKLYDEYKRLGGNLYLDDWMERERKKHEEAAR